MGQIQGGIGRALCLGTMGQVCLAEVITTYPGGGGTPQGGALAVRGLRREKLTREQRLEEDVILAIIIAEDMNRK